MKLDFVKAFDTVEHSELLSIMQHMGFPARRIHWITMLLSTGTSSVLLNGFPKKKILCKRGVRHGDPLSPLLFVLAAELLQYVINDPCNCGRLTIPIPQPDSDFHIVQYTDDTLLLMQADVAQLISLSERAVGKVCRLNWSQGQFQQIFNYTHRCPC